MYTTWQADRIDSGPLYNSPRVISALDYYRGLAMMAQSWGEHDGFGPPSYTSGFGGSDRFDDDLFRAALLFLDDHDSSDSDSYSTRSTQATAIEPLPAYYPPWHHHQHQQHEHQEQTWHSLDEDETKYDKSSLQVQVRLPREDASHSSSLSQSAPLPWTNSTALGAALETPRKVNKRREEIKQLRTQAHVLQARLDALHMQPLDRADNDDGPAITAALGLAWQSIANRQLEQRNRAESENRRLKGLVADHKRTASALKRLVARHANAKSWEPFRPSASVPELAPELDDPAIFDVLLGSLKPMLEQVDSILANVTAFNAPTIKKERYGEDHLTVRFVNARVVPFGVAETTAAVWNYLLVHEKPRPYEWTQLCGDTYQGQFASHTRLGDCEGHAKSKLVMRRVDEPHRTVFVRNAMLQNVSAPAYNRFLVAPLRHFQWTVVDKPTTLGNGSAHDKMCRVVTCSVSIPRLDVGNQSDESRDTEMDEIEDICGSISMHQWDEASKIVDNLLLGSSDFLTPTVIPPR